MNKVDIIVCFTDGTEKSIKDVTEYSYNQNINKYIVEKGGYKLFFNADCVLYIGIKSELE